MGSHRRKPALPGADPLQTLDKQQKIALLEQMDKFARSLDPAINQVMASISGVYEEILWPPPMAPWPPTCAPGAPLGDRHRREGGSP